MLALESNAKYLLVASDEREHGGWDPSVALLPDRPRRLSLLYVSCVSA